MPGKGWLNDPNGLVYFKGRFHIFYQADQESLDGNINKSWGHYSTTDFVTYKHHNLAILPDTVFDRNGAYSGSAVIKDGKLYLFYTGNVKHTGEHDYVVSGREHNLMRVESDDGIHFANKCCLMTNDDYPCNCTKHVRDPKIYEKDGLHHLLLGARLLDNTSCVLEYTSNDLISWKFINRYKANELIGYMIECPDYFSCGGKEYILCSPQGLTKQDDLYHNKYDCGYYEIKNDCLVNYESLDYGFDYYASQTFYGIDNNIMIGWVGMPDNDYINYCEYWSQALSMPRKIYLKNNKIYSFPIDEIFNLRLDKHVYSNNFIFSKSSNLEANIKGDFEIKLNNVKLIYNDRNICLDLLECNCGRNKRFISNIAVDKISIFVDESVLEIYFNDGEYVMTTRFYDYSNNLTVVFDNIEFIEAYEMKGFVIE